MYVVLSIRDLSGTLQIYTIEQAQLGHKNKTLTKVSGSLVPRALKSLHCVYGSSNA